MDHHYAISGLCLMRDLLMKYPRLVPMLENDIIATGIHMPLMDTPEHTNALASTVWEMGFHLRHYHPWCRMHGKHVLYGAPL
jgi:nucleolar complex protein 3